MVWVMFLESGWKVKREGQESQELHLLFLPS
jgi:hypothetical protein